MRVGSPAIHAHARRVDIGRLAIGLLLAAQLCLGIAHVAGLPPWEGFDEPGHFSSIQQIADRGVVPRLPSALMSATVESYASSAPLAYSAQDAPGTTAISYRQFFASSPALIEEGRRAVHEPPPAPRRYEPGVGGNYIAQHPPLNAILLTPLYRLTSALSLGDQLLALRLACYLMAWTALAVGVQTTGALAGRDARASMAVAAAWPLLMPSWFPAMARLGNDALTALLLAALWAWLVARGCRRVSSALVVGLLLGAGALAKAFFVPIGVVTCAWIVAASWNAGTRARLGAIGRAATAAAIAVAACSWWYLGASAVALAGGEPERLAAMGGLWPSLAARFSILGWLDGMAAFAGLGAWPGTWSLVHPPHVLLAPLLAAMAGAVVAYGLVLRHRPLQSPAWLPGLWLGALLAGFAYHVLVHVALTGSGRGVGGYYLHVLVAPLACALGVGIGAGWRVRGVRLAALAGAAYASAFLTLVAWAQLLLFTGQLGRNAAKGYALVEPIGPWLGVPRALARLDVLAFPRAAVVLAACGTCLVLAGALALGRFANEKSVSGA